MRNLVVLLAPLVLFGPSVATAQADNRVTILYDAFGSVATMTKDWGFSALIEIGGKRFLFDTGNNAEVFARNAEHAGIDLTDLDSSSCPTATSTIRPVSTIWCV